MPGTEPGIRDCQDGEYKRLREVLSKIRELYEKGSFDDAIKLAETIPLDSQALFLFDTHDKQNLALLGNIYVKKGMRDKAVSFYQEVGSDIAAEYNRAAWLSFRDKKYEEAEYWHRLCIKYCVEQVSEQSSSYIAYARSSVALACKGLGKIYLETDQAEKALSFFKMGQRLGVDGVERALKKAMQFSHGKEKQDEILKLIPKELTLPDPTIDEMLERATSAAKGIMWKDHWTEPEKWKDPYKGYKMWNGNESPRPEHPMYDGTVAKRKIIDEFWTEECTEALRRTVKKWRWEASGYIRDEVMKALGPKKAKLLENRLHEDYYYPVNAIMYYAMSKKNELGLSYPRPQHKKCKLCGKSFFEGHIMGSLARHLKFPAEPVEFCPKCLASALLGGFKQPKSREEMKTDLRKLVEACGFIPPKDFMSIGRYSSLHEKLPKEKLIEIIPVLIEILPHEIYEMEFGSWLKALIESGVLSDDAKREIYGTRCLAKDGHECLSLAEKIIDDWLSANGISHLKEPFYPKDEVLNPEGNMRGDWKTGDVLIEFFGMVGVPEYEQKMRQKRELAKETHMNLIEISPDDLYDLSKKLGKLKNPYMQEDTA